MNPELKTNSRILVIDDNRAIHDDFRKILCAQDSLQAAEARMFGKEESIPFALDSACQGEEGLALARQALAEGRPYALAFIDVRMPPGWDGVETTKRLWDVCPDLQVVICTAYADYSWAELSGAVGHLDRLLILKKPFDSIEVMQLARALTEKWRLHQVSALKFADLDRIVAERTREIEDSRLAALNMMEDAVDARTRTEQANEALRGEITERKRAEAKKRAEEERYLRQRNALIAFAGNEDGKVEDLTATIRRLTESDARTLGVARVSVWRYNPDRTAIRCVDLYELEADRHSAGVELSGAMNPAYFRALADLDVIAAHDALHDARTCEFAETYLRPLGITSLLDAPIQLGGAVEGVLCHEHVGPARQWTADEETFTVAVANRASLALEGAERQRAEEALAKTQQRQRHVFEMSREALMTLFPPAWKFTSANAATVRLFEAKDETDFITRGPEGVSPERQPDGERSSVKAQRMITSAMENGSHFFDWTHQRITGEAFPATVMLTRIESEGRIGLHATVRDITEQKRAEFELEQTHNQLLAVSRQAGMAEFATGILHNVGNVLSSVNVASSCMSDSLRKSKSASLGKVVALMREHEGDLGSFFSHDPKGKQVPGYLGQLADHLAGERDTALKELGELQKNIEHIKSIISVQQDSARMSRSPEAVQLADLIEDALQMNANGLQRAGIQVFKEFEAIPPILMEKHKVLQILVNLVRNAMQAFEGASNPEKRLTLRVSQEAGRVRIVVADSGGGILPENLSRIFVHGFTTKKDGHGFGLYSAVAAAKEMGGSLAVQSDGPGLGAAFTLELPIKI